MRVLCSRWSGFSALVYASDAHCLPHVMAAKGYATTALHSFEPQMFWREKVYPNMGFQQTLFRDALYARGARHCPGLFPGACDRDVPAIIGRQLRAAKQPQFIYWLTLNSHLPVIGDAMLDTQHCPPDLAARLPGHTMICRQAVVWRETLDSLDRMLADPALPPVDVLIVGDHMPPYFDQRDRSEFDPGAVPWLLLRARAASSRVAAPSDKP
jgi:phosphoglycerol transferase MdoB-like AlkP superfamily enzyme